jgi:hypothetical protein
VPKTYIELLYTVDDTMGIGVIFGIYIDTQCLTRCDKDKGFHYKPAI